MASPPVCPQCSQELVSPDALHLHCVSQTDHLYCAECRKLFFRPEFEALHRVSQAHDPTSAQVDVATCYVCNRDFPAWVKLMMHCVSKPDHFFCKKECGRVFTTASELREHMKRSGHRPDRPSKSFSDDFSCGSCSRQCFTEDELHEHLAAQHYWCFKCDRDFGTWAALHQHKISIAHKPRTSKCIMCHEKFKEPSSIAAHIESGRCNKSVTRHDVVSAVQALEVKPSILIHESRAIEAIEHGPGGEIASPNTLGLGMRSTTITTVSATEDAFDGDGYVCWVCERSFRDLEGLNKHLSSPAHDSLTFKCPRCENQFKMISSLIQHLESETCGLARITAVEDEANILSAQFARLLGF
ncbi:hypothetical protein BDZ89DRAFT_1065892 [Hymenopellis radicata]|nr:hypothetical protein BDZ89DRAFT_1065892 [Hymenopellis radicata]